MEHGRTFVIFIWWMVNQRWYNSKFERPRKTGPWTHIQEATELAIIKDVRKCVQKTLVQFDCTADCIVWWMLFIAERMVVCDWSTWLNTFHKCEDASFMWSIFHWINSEILGIEIDIAFSTGSKIGKGFENISSRRIFDCSCFFEETLNKNCPRFVLGRKYNWKDREIGKFEDENQFPFVSNYPSLQLRVSPTHLVTLVAKNSSNED